jgi:hypothetical protein
MTSSEWFDYLLSELEKSLASSSIQLLGFNWAEQLYAYILDLSSHLTSVFTVQKYRSAIFYLNYSVRQMRVDSDLDGFIRRKHTQLQKRLRRLD